MDTLRKTGLSLVACIATLLAAVPSAHGRDAETGTTGGAAWKIIKTDASGQTIVVDSPSLHCTDTVAVWTPSKKALRKAGIKDASEIPTLLLLHGRSGRSGRTSCWWNWSSQMDLQALSDETHFRIICPDGFPKSWYLDSVDPSGKRWRTFFWNELWPLLKSRYGLAPDRTFITGLSMGGHGAMNLFLDHPELFRGAGSMSGVLNLAHSASAPKDTKSILGITSPDDPAFQKECAVNRIGRVKQVCGDAARDKILVISCGDADKHFVPTAWDFASACRKEGLRYILMISPGAHKWSCWVWTIRYHIDWFTQAMNGGKLGE